MAFIAPQTQTAPIYPVNAKYTNGVAPGYYPTAGSGLTLNIGKGTAFCSGSPVTYAGGTLTMTASTTNYIYLNTASSCAVAGKTTAFTSTDIPIAVVVTGGSSITSITDDRTMFFPPGSSSSGLSDPGSNGIVKRISLGTTSVAAVADIYGLWTDSSCSTNHYLKNDGTCGAGGGSGYPGAVSSTLVSSANEIDATGCMSSTYKDYYIRVYVGPLASGSVTPAVQFGNGGTYDGTAGHYHFGRGSYGITNGVTGFNANQSAQGIFPTFNAGDTGWGSNDRITMNLWVHNATSSANPIFWEGNSSVVYAGNRYGGVASGDYAATSFGAITDVRVALVGGAGTPFPSGSYIICQPLPQ